MSASHEDLRQAGRALFRDGLVAREVVRPLVIFAANLAFYLGLQVFIAVTPSAVAKAGLGFLAGIATSTLFIIGHDCAHGSFTRSTSLNRILGSIAMLPGLHPYSLWERGHNQVHHRFTLQMDRDNAFPPLSPRAYAALSPWRRAYYRFLRSAAGQLTYYLVEIWLPTMVLPIKKEIGPFKKSMRRIWRY